MKTTLLNTLCIISLRDDLKKCMHKSSKCSIVQERSTSAGLNWESKFTKYFVISVFIHFLVKVMLIIHIIHSEGYKKSKKKKAKVYTQDHWPTQPKFILISLEHEVTKSITTPPLKGMLVHYKVTPFPECHQASLTIRWYSSWVERQCERKVFAQEQNMSTWPELVSAIQQFCITFCSMICL